MCHQYIFNVRAILKESFLLMENAKHLQLWQYCMYSEKYAAATKEAEIGFSLGREKFIAYTS